MSEANFLGTVARHKMIDFLRKQRDKSLDSILRRRFSNSDDPYEHLGFRSPGEQSKGLHAALFEPFTGTRENLPLQALPEEEWGAALTEKQKQVVQLSREGWRQVQIAIKMGISQPMVSKHLKYAKKKRGK